jgi:LemA protein
MKKINIIILAVVVILTLWVWSSYNKLVTMNEKVDSQWAQVETQYQRRFDLIPNLVDSVKGAMAQEKEIFTALADARTKYSGARTVSEKVASAGQVESALGRLLAVVENYPTLKSVDTVQSLMSQIEGTENRIAVERKRFNDLIAQYNISIKRFPTIIIAKIFDYDNKIYFESVNNADVAPKVSF